MILKKRLLGLLLTAALMIGLCCPATALGDSPKSGGSGAIVYIPLDNRPWSW